MTNSLPPKCSESVHFGLRDSRCIRRTLCCSPGRGFSFLQNKCYGMRGLIFGDVFVQRLESLALVVPLFLAVIGFHAV